MNEIIQSLVIPFGILGAIIAISTLYMLGSLFVSKMKFEHNIKELKARIEKLYFDQRDLVSLQKNLVMLVNDHIANEREQDMRLDALLKMMTQVNDKYNQRQVDDHEQHTIDEARWSSYDAKELLKDLDKKK